MKKHAAGYVTPAPSTGFTSDVRCEFVGAEAALRFEYWRDGGQCRSALLFQGVRAVRYRAEIHCTAWEIEGAFDTLVRVVGSRWVAELREAMPEPERTEDQSMTMHHYLIFLDSFGAFEVVARSWAAVPEEVGAWG